VYIAKLVVSSLWIHQHTMRRNGKILGSVVTSTGVKTVVVAPDQQVRLPTSQFQPPISIMLISEHPSMSKGSS
jgi:hypothetical protein